MKIGVRGPLEGSVRNATQVVEQFVLDTIREIGSVTNETEALSRARASKARLREILKRVD